MNVRISIVLSVLLLSGCGGRHISDVTDSQPDTCPVHDISMTIELVPVELGIALVTDYDAMRDRFFPFCGDALRPGRCLAVAEHESARVRVCPECFAKKIEWQEDMSCLCRGATNAHSIVDKWSTEPTTSPYSEPAARTPQG
jgi:hypothetical protein